jgi:hypothetical protein
MTSQSQGKVPLALMKLAGLPPGALTLVSVTKISPFQVQQEITNSPDGVTLWAGSHLGVSSAWAWPSHIHPTSSLTGSIQKIFFSFFLFFSCLKQFLKFPEHSGPSHTQTDQALTQPY